MKTVCKIALLLFLTRAAAAAEPVLTICQKPLACQPVLQFCAKPPTGVHAHVLENWNALCEPRSLRSLTELQGALKKSTQLTLADPTTLKCYSESSQQQNSTQVSLAGSINRYLSSVGESAHCAQESFGSSADFLQYVFHELGHSLYFSALEHCPGHSGGLQFQVLRIPEILNGFRNHANDDNWSIKNSVYFAFDEGIATFISRKLNPLRDGKTIDDFDSRLPRAAQELQNLSQSQAIERTDLHQNEYLIVAFLQKHYGNLTLQQIADAACPPAHTLKEFLNRLARPRGTQDHWSCPM